MKKKVFYSLFLLIAVYGFPGFSIAQTIEGEVFNSSSKEPLVGVNVYLTKTKQGTTTNQKGFFSIKLKKPTKANDTLVFSYVGFRTQKITINELKRKANQIKMEMVNQNIDEVRIIDSRQNPTLINFKELTPLNDELYAFGAQLIQDKIYVIGGNFSIETNIALKVIREYGFAGLGAIINSTASGANWQKFSDKMYIYDLQLDKWIVSDVVFRERAYHNIHFFNGKFYVMGGKRLSTNRKIEYLDETIEVYDILNNSLVIDETNPHQAINFTSFIHKDNLIVLGGSVKMDVEEKKMFSGKMHLFNFTSGLWYEIGTMSEPKETKGILIGNKLYLVGGYNGKALNEIESYDFYTGTWSVEGQLFFGAERPATTYYNNLIYIFENERFYTFNLQTKALRMYAIDLPLKYAELFYSNNKLYILGGYTINDYSATPSAKLYCIDISEFRKTKIIDSNVNY